jgi:hypothetical protein
MTHRDFRKLVADMLEAQSVYFAERKAGRKGWDELDKSKALEARVKADQDTT